jgi:hypothetical protein
MEALQGIKIVVMPIRRTLSLGNHLSDMLLLLFIMCLCPTIYISSLVLSLQAQKFNITIALHNGKVVS